MKSARINFGIPDSEYILEVDDSGAATSLVNQDTGTEYVGGGGDSEVVEVKFVRGTKSGYIPLELACAADYGYECASTLAELQAADNEKIVNVILYKGKCYAFPPEGCVFLADNYDSDTECIIGAGTITINAG